VQDPANLASFRAKLSYIPGQDDSGSPQTVMNLAPSFSSSESSGSKDAQARESKRGAD
jgi:hypothetical protein